MSHRESVKRSIAEMAKMRELGMSSNHGY